MNCIMAGFPVLYYLPEFVQTCAHTIFNNTDYIFETRLGEQILYAFTKKKKKKKKQLCEVMVELI